MQEGEIMKNKFGYLNRVALLIIAVVTMLTLVSTLRAAPASGLPNEVSVDIGRQGAATRSVCATPVIEQYGIGGSTPLRWRAFVPNDRLQHPAIIVIHGGAFKDG